MINRNKLLKFIQRLDNMVGELEEKRELIIHQKIDQSYYMQKSAELKILLERFDEVDTQAKQIAFWINDDSTKVFVQWKKDMRWIRAYNQTGKLEGPVL